MTRGRTLLLAVCSLLSGCTPEPGLEPLEPSDGFGGLGGGGAGSQSELPSPEPCDGSCSAGETCCQGTCVDLARDAEHCGACGSSCSQEGGAGVCEHGECTVTCDSEHADCDGTANNGCESPDPGTPTAVEGLRPTLGAFTGSLITAELTGALRPTFTWQATEASACDELTYEIQVDDSCPLEEFADCSFETPEIDEITLEAEFTPEADLPVSEVVPVGTRYFWRVRSCDVLERCSAWSAVRYLDVGRERQDVTGDGYADILLQYVTGTQNPYVLIPGGPRLGAMEEGQSAEIQALQVFDQINIISNPPVIRFVGDVNGDGFQDFVADGPIANASLPTNGTLTPSEVINCPMRLLYLGAADFQDMEVVFFSSSTWAPGGVAHNFGAGDFDADGYADIWAGQSVDFVPGDGVTPDQEPRVFLFRGRPDVATLPAPTAAGSTLADFDGVWTPSLSIEHRPDDNGNFLGISVEPGDFNGDGQVDAALVAPRAHQLYLVLGGIEGAFVARSVSYGGPDVHEFDCGDVRLSVGDLNRDGFDDVALNCDSTHLIEVYFGGDPLPTDLARSELVFPEAGRGLYDNLLADLDADGSSELITGSTWGGGKAPDPIVWVFPGSYFEEQGGAPEQLPVSESAGYFGAADHNGDGFTDLVVAGSPASWIPGNGTLDLSETTSSGSLPITPRKFMGVAGPVNTKTVAR